MSTTSDGGDGTQTGVGNHLATLVPSFDPSKDDMQTYQQKVELLLSAWPKTKIPELVTRLILNSSGSAFAKLQLHHAELMENDEKSVRKLIELLGGQWGKIGIERQYRDAEQALYHLNQYSDESNDSFLARADVAWSKLLSQKLSLEDLQAFILLRGSNLTPDEKKRVILEADNSLEGKLTVRKVTDAVRLLGAAFLNRKPTKPKVYSATALVTDDVDTEEAFNTQDEITEEDFVECLLNEGDSDAALVSDYEAAANEVLQEDTELASAYSAYVEARKRLTEKFKNRGFWQTSSWSFGQFSKGKGGSSKGFQKGKSTGFQKNRKSLQDRILNSTCRLCNRKGHWKAECPYRNSNGSGNASSTTSSTAAGSVPVTTVTVDQSSDVLPLEFMQLPSLKDEAIDDAFPIFGCFHNERGVQEPCCPGGILGESDNGNRDNNTFPSAYDRLKSWNFRNEQPTTAKMRLARRLMSRNPMCREHQPNAQFVVQSQPGVERLSPPKHVEHEATACFATHGSYGIVDLGASKTVIGSDSLGELIQSLDASIRQRLSRCPCNITFRFGNQATLTSRQALVVPIGSLKLKIAVVPGGTPFLISNTLMRTLQARIDCASQTLSSSMLKQKVPLQLTPKGLFLIDLNQLIRASCDDDMQKPRQVCAETFVSDETEKSTAEAMMSKESNHRDVGDPHDSSQDVPVSPCQKVESVQSQPTEAGKCQAVDRRQTQTVDCPIPCHRHVVLEPASSSAADPINHNCGRFGSPDAGRPRLRSCGIRTETCRPDVQRDVGRPGMGPIHDQQIPEEHQRITPPIPQVGRAQGGVHGAGPNGSPAKHSARLWPCRSQSQADGQIVGHPIKHLFAGWRTGMGYGARDVSLHDYGADTILPAGGDDRAPGEDAQPGECPDKSDSTHGRPSPSGEGQCAGRDPVRDDWESDVLTAMPTEAVELGKMIELMSQELDDVKNTTRPLGNKWMLGEVMCSPNSPLCQQMLQLGQSAFRFGLDQGDLSTVEGRAKLFQLLCRHRPKHIWYSPVCGPWSSWSQLNASRSLYHQQEYQNKRNTMLYQIALGMDSTLSTPS